MTRVALLIGLLHAAPAWGCSILCNGLEVKQTFIVDVQISERPLEGAEVVIEGPLKKTFRTTRGGTVKVGPLPSGIYSIRARKLGVEVAYECAVKVSTRRQAIGSLKLDLKDAQEQMVRAAGRLAEPGKTIRNPLAGKRVLLSGFFGGEWESITSSDGTFRFPGVPDGFYSLRFVDVGAMVVQITASAEQQELDVLFFADTSCGPMLIVDPFFP